MLKSFFIFLCLNLLFFGLSQRAVRAQGIGEQRREIAIVKGLIVNDNNNFRSIVYKDEKRGVTDMRKLLQSSRVEECWIYLPEKEKWVEIGRGEAPEKKLDNRYVTKVSLDVRFMEELLDNNSFLVVYHIHPTYTLFLKDKMEERRENDISIKANEREKERVLYLMRRTFPSEQDLRNMIENTMVFYEKNPLGEITFKICSHYGITEYKLTEKGKQYFVSDDYFGTMKKIILTCRQIQNDMIVASDMCEQQIRKTINLFYRTKMHSKQKRRNPSRVKRDFGFQIEGAIESMSNEYMKIIFVPH